jgi:hypothetical protein
LRGKNLVLNDLFAEIRKQGSYMLTSGMRTS